MNRRVLAHRVGSFVGTMLMRTRVIARRSSAATPVAESGRLHQRPRPRPTGTTAPGLHRLRTTAGREAVLSVPSGYRPGAPLPFVLSLHGAGGTAEGGLYPFRDLADRAGIALLSPKSLGPTWDLVMRALGPDVTAIDEFLGQVFEGLDVDPERLAIAGFSDGASYALSLGLANGDLFAAVMAFSPGFAAPPTTIGEPRVFVSHGTEDAVLHIDATSRRIVPMLEEAGYDVAYVEFTGPHAVPSEIAVTALDWFLGSGWAAD